MTVKQTADLSQEMFQVLKQFSRVKWENCSIQELKPSECELLGTLYITLANGTSAIPASALSNQLNITPAAVTHLLNPLESGGFIKRDKKPDDKRFVLISLTGKGKKVAETLLEDESENLARLVHHLGKDNSQTFLRLMSSTINFFTDQPVTDLKTE
jgi:DNA-binding MarR family transcriptional regulator